MYRYYIKLLLHIIKQQYNYITIQYVYVMYIDVMNRQNVH